MQGGNHRDARWRRALLAEDGGDEAESGEDEEGQDAGGAPMLLSDEEDEQALHLYKQRRLMEESQVIQACVAFGP